MLDLQGIKMEEILEYMLENDVIEERMIQWINNRTSDSFLAMMTAIIERDKADAGLILSIYNEEMETGAEHIVFFEKETQKRLTITNIVGGNGKNYALAFTSKKRFEACNDTSGVVMFIGELIELLAVSEKVDGLVLNIKNEEIVLDKKMIKALYACMEKKECCLMVS